MNLNAQGMETVLNHVKSGLILINSDGVVEFVNPCGLELLAEQEEIIGQNIKELWLEDLAEEVAFDDLLVKLEEEKFADVKERIEIKREQKKDSTMIIFSGERTRANLATKIEILAEAVDNVKNAIYATNEQGNIIYTNQIFNKKYNYKQEDILGASSDILWSDKAENLAEHELRGKDTFYHKTSKGRKFPVAIKQKEVKVDNELVNLYIVEDLSYKIEFKEKISENIGIDDLTGVLTRKIGLKFLDKYINLAEKNSYVLSIIYLDINDLKFINDEYGVERGDELIIHLSEVLNELLNDSDEVCRFREDEFLLILPDYSNAEAEELVVELRDRLDEFNISQMKPYEISISVGIAEYQPDDSDNINELIAVAEERMHKDKLKYYSRKKEQEEK